LIMTSVLLRAATLFVFVSACSTTPAEDVPTQSPLGDPDSLESLSIVEDVFELNRGADHYYEVTASWSGAEGVWLSVDGQMAAGQQTDTGWLGQAGSFQVGFGDNATASSAVATEDAVLGTAFAFGDSLYCDAESTCLATRYLYVWLEEGGNVQLYADVRGPAGGNATVQIKELANIPG
jgi:hypothetical protein